MINEKSILIAQKLISNTNAGKITWDEDQWNNGYTTRLGENKILVQIEDDGKWLYIYNANGKAIEAVSDKNIMDFTNEDSEIIENLYTIAMRSALKSDEAIDDILSRLD